MWKPSLCSSSFFYNDCQRHADQLALVRLDQANSTTTPWGTTLLLLARYPAAGLAIPKTYRSKANLTADPGGGQCKNENPTAYPSSMRDTQRSCAYGFRSGGSW